MQLSFLAESINLQPEGAQCADGMCTVKCSLVNGEFTVPWDRKKCCNLRCESCSLPVHKYNFVQPRRDLPSLGRGSREKIHSVFAAAKSRGDLRFASFWPVAADERAGNDGIPQFSLLFPTTIRATTKTHLGGTAFRATYIAHQLEAGFDCKYIET